VAAIAAARGLTRVAPYFIDEDAGDGPRVADASVGTDGELVGAGRVVQAASAPIGGLTVIAFRNTHLMYAITWYGLSLLVIVGAWIVIREERRRA